MKSFDLLTWLAMTGLLSLCSGCGRENESQPAKPTESQADESVRANAEPTATAERHDAGLKPSIQVLSPNGGESIQANKPFTVKWSSQGIDDAKLRIKAHGGGDENPGGWYTLAENVTNAGTCTCTSLGGGWNRYKIHVSTMDGEVIDASDDFFAITLVPERPSTIPTPQPPVEDEKRILAALRKAGALIRIDEATGQAIELSLVDTDISDATMAEIGKLIHLKGLVLTDSRLDKSGLMHIAGLTSLLGLRLRGTDVTDEGLKHLERLTNLIALDLQETAATKTALQRLADQLPKCSIIANDFRTEIHR